MPDSARDRAPDVGHDPLYLGLSIDTWVKVAILTPLFVALYWLVLRWLWDKTNPLYGEANWGHAICIPAVGLYYLYINRDDLMKQPVEPLLLGRFMNPWRLYPAIAMIAMGGLAMLIGSDPGRLVQAAGVATALLGAFVLLLDWGLGSLLFGLLLFAFGIWPGQNQFVQGVAMIVTLFGIVLMLTGWKVMKYAWFPIFYLICGIPWPALVYSYIASPLQILAAGVAVNILRFTGVNAYRTGTKINMGGITDPLRTLNVAEACAGLRSLMTFITVGFAVAFLSSRPLWQKLIITVSSVPIAIFCNVMRVAGQGLLDHYINRQLSESFAHQFVGLVMLVPAFFMILLVAWVLDHLFVEEADDATALAQKRAAMGGAVAGGLVVDIPRKPVIPPIPPTSHAAPRATKPAAASPTAPPAAKPATTLPSNRPVAAPAPVRPAMTPPRPGASQVPPRPASRPPIPPTPPTPRPPKEGA